MVFLLFFDIGSMVCGAGINIYSTLGSLLQKINENQWFFSILDFGSMVCGAHKTVFPWLRPAGGDSVLSGSAGSSGKSPKAELLIGFLSFNPPQKIIKFQDINTIFDSPERSIIKISFDILVPKGPKNASNQ